VARIAIVGVGAIGGALAGLLAENQQHEIVLCTRRPVQSLLVQSPAGSTQINFRNWTSPAQAEAVDFVLVATKTYDAETTAAWFPRLTTNDTPVAIVQNGVEHRERFAQWLKPEQILPVIIDCPCERMPESQPGTQHVLRRATALIKTDNSPLGLQLTALLAGSDAEITLVEDFVTAAWSKLCINSAGALNAITSLPAEIIHQPEIAAIAAGMVSECAAVARAVGAKLDEKIVAQVMDGYRAQAPKSVNSMLADRLAGRTMEIDARNGVIVRRGAEFGIATPLNAMAVALLRAVQG
jgi:2-dehydropantoate 2-reductase